MDLEKEKENAGRQKEKEKEREKEKEESLESAVGDHERKALRDRNHERADMQTIKRDKRFFLEKYLSVKDACISNARNVIIRQVLENLYHHISLEI